MDRKVVDRLLGGEEIDRSGLRYDFDAHHLAMIASGPGAEGLLREIAESLGRELLLGGGVEATSGWLGGGHPLEEVELGEIAALADRGGSPLAIGESARGLAGWRRTHRQARAAFGLATRHPRPFIRYADVALLAAVAGDADLADFLGEQFIAPLLSPGDRSLDLPATLRAYVHAGADISSAAEALSVSRQTVTGRMAAIEERIGRPPCGCLAELDLALRLVDHP